MTTAPPAPRPRLALVEVGCGPVMLFQHGLCGDARQPVDVFPSEAFRCLTVECRGHGGSEAGDPEAFGIAAFADDVAAMLDERRLGPLPIGGISMGAAIALRLAVVRPDLVGALVLARPAWVTEDGPDNMRPNAEVGALLARHDAADARAIFEAGKTAARLSKEGPDNLASLRGFFSRAPLTVTSALLTRISADGPGVRREQVAGLRTPTLVIGHARDAVHPLAMARELAALIPGSRLSIIPPKADDLEGYRAAFRASLRTFLEEHRR